MATTTQPEPQRLEVRMIPLSEIRHDQNVRHQLDLAEIDALASSIALLGQLTPISVRPDTENGAGWVLIAGHRRHAALVQLGHSEIRAEIRHHDGPEIAGVAEASERLAENVVRAALSPHEEALALRTMLDRGLTQDGAARALGWPRHRVTARMKLLELPERAQQLTGQGVIPLSAVEELRQIGCVSPQLLDVLVEHVDSDDGRWVARELAGNTGRALGEALRHTQSKVFAAHLDQIRSYDIEQLLSEAEARHGRAAEDRQRRVGYERRSNSGGSAPQTLLASKGSGFGRLPGCVAR
jgi:ParB/RepB/Spo0J family partition protein